MDRAIKEKRKLFEDWNSGGDKALFLAAKLMAKQVVYGGKTRARRELLGSLSATNERDNVFNVEKRMKRDNRDVVGEQCVRDDSGRVVVGGAELREAWRAHHDRVSNVEFVWDRDSLDPVVPVSDLEPRID